jgi:hypothetical protein
MAEVNTKEEGVEEASQLQGQTHAVGDAGGHESGATDKDVTARGSQAF